jgi:hypothetical protein
MRIFYIKRIHFQKKKTRLKFHFINALFIFSIQKLKFIKYGQQSFSGQF